MAEFTQARPLTIAVDLTHLLSGGTNGGVKPFIFEYLKWLGSQRHVPVRLLFLTRGESHAEVRSLARFGDELICLVGGSGGGDVRTPVHSPSERSWLDAPGDLTARLGADILYCPFGQCTWSFPGIPTLATIVDVLHRDYPFSLSPDVAAHRENVFQETMRTADTIQGISEFTLSRVAHHYGFPRDRMFCSPIAIHERLRPRVELPGQDRIGRPYFFYPANAWRHKNHEVLFLAYGIYRSQAGDGAWDLVLTGHDDQAMRELLSLASTLGLGANVRFLGHLTDDRFGAVWSEASALVFPSLHEGFGIPLVEAMAFGLPVLSSRAGALPEVGGDACLYADTTKPLELAEALSRIASDGPLRARLRERGYDRLKSFSFERDARRFLDELLACARRPARRTTKGYYTDGWTAPKAYFGTPNTSQRERLELALRPMQAERSLKVYHGSDLIGQVRVPPATSPILRFPVFPRGRPVTLIVPDATRLSDADHRTHGVQIASLSLRDGAGIETDLLVP